MWGLKYFIQASLGLAIFLIGLRVMSQGLNGVLGQKLGQILGKLTTTPFRGMVLGAIATALVQSSSTIAVTMVALVNAQVITIYQAFGIILGANIGTTFTAQIISFDLSSFALPIILLGLLLLPINRKCKIIGVAMIGFGSLFFGMRCLRLSLAPIIELPAVRDLVLRVSNNLLEGIFTGATLTALIQSSTATTGIVIALAQENAISLSGAIALSLGANIGTVFTTIISSIGLEKEARATALADLIFNVLGVLGISLIFGPFILLVSLTSPHLPRQVANAHTLFNVITVLFVMPFIAPLMNLCIRWAGFKFRRNE